MLLILLLYLKTLNRSIRFYLARSNKTLLNIEEIHDQLQGTLKTNKAKLNKNQQIVVGDFVITTTKTYPMRD